MKHCRNWLFDNSENSYSHIEDIINKSEQDLGV